MSAVLLKRDRAIAGLYHGCCSGIARLGAVHSAGLLDGGWLIMLRRDRDVTICVHHNCPCQ